MTKPAHVRAKAPVARFAVLLSFGNELECSAPFITASPLPAAARLALCRSALRLEKYIADPKPVRSVLGNVPLQNWRMGFGPLAIDRMVASSVFECDCWTRVLRRSAGCKRTAESMPEFRPAKKCTAKRLARQSRPRPFHTYNKTTRAFRHLTLPRRQKFNCYIVVMEAALCIMPAALGVRPYICRGETS
jgi:hypothetical protein